MSKKAKKAITPTREENFPDWYQEVIKAADMAENSPVRGCMIIKPYGFGVWENIQRIFDAVIKDLGVQNAYFPLLIPLSFIAREAEHVDGFAKECAVVTHHRLESGKDGGLVPAGKLEEPFVIRPTSETIIGDAMARWVQSYRDLPLKLNQWCNVMRWEMRTRMFLRTSEFLWQEGHNAFETEEEARDDALKMLNAYLDFSENTLAMPAIAGQKTEDEKFPGAETTYTFELMMQDGKALQGGTSHYMGQTFARSIGIKFQGREGQEEFAHTTSWGISTRLIGALIMTHGDDDGMIMPPRVAPYQVAIIPITKDDQDSAAIIEYAKQLVSKLKEKGIRPYLDSSDERTPNKMWAAIKKGIPLRVEIGVREVEEGTLTHVRRDIGRDSKASCSVDEFVTHAAGLLDQVHAELLRRARAFMKGNTKEVSGVGDIESFYQEGGVGFVRADVSVLSDAVFEKVAKEYSLTARCLPFADKGKKVIIGKAY